MRPRPETATWSLRTMIDVVVVVKGEMRIGGGEVRKSNGRNVARKDNGLMEKAVSTGGCFAGTG